MHLEAFRHRLLEGEELSGLVEPLLQEIFENRLGLSFCWIATAEKAKGRRAVDGERRRKQSDAKDFRNRSAHVVPYPVIFV